MKIISIIRMDPRPTTVYVLNTDLYYSMIDRCVKQASTPTYLSPEWSRIGVLEDGRCFPIHAEARVGLGDDIEVQINT